MIDISLAKKILNWQPNVTIEEGIRRTANWYMNELENTEMKFNDNK